MKQIQHFWSFFLILAYFGLFLVIFCCICALITSTCDKSQNGEQERDGSTTIDRVSPDPLSSTLVNEHFVRIDGVEILDEIQNQTLDEISNDISDDIQDQIPDVVINIETNEFGLMESKKNQSLPPPSYDEVINNGTDLTNPPPSYSESVRFNKSFVIKI